MFSISGGGYEHREHGRDCHEAWLDLRQDWGPHTRPGSDPPLAATDIHRLVLSPPGEPHGINVWYHLHENQINRAPPESPENSFTISVHGDFEAVVEDVLGMIRVDPDRPDTLVAVNPRRVAVAVNRQSRRGTVLPMERILPALEDTEKMRLQAWLASPASPIYVVPVDELPD